VTIPLLIVAVPVTLLAVRVGELVGMGVGGVTVGPEGVGAAEGAAVVGRVQ
jgi:hypothetical protein